MPHTSGRRGASCGDMLQRDKQRHGARRRQHRVGPPFTRRPTGPGPQRRLSATEPTCERERHPLGHGHGCTWLPPQVRFADCTQSCHAGRPDSAGAPTYPQQAKPSCLPDQQWSLYNHLLASHWPAKALRRRQVQRGTSLATPFASHAPTSDTPPRHGDPALRVADTYSKPPRNYQRGQPSFAEPPTLAPRLPT